MAATFHNASFQNSTSGGGHLTTAPDSPVRHAELYALNGPRDACVGSGLLTFSLLLRMFLYVFLLSLKSYLG